MNQDVAVTTALCGAEKGLLSSISWFTWFTNRRRVPILTPFCQGNAPQAFTTPIQNCHDDRKE
jgi:hypothetical protein